VGSTCQEIFAMGLRNPFRIAFDPNAAATRFFINDVGQNIWEEIDLGARGADYGWNLREGHCQQTGLETDCGTPTPAGFTNPYYDYGHSTGCGSITGGAFVPGGVWPAAYTGTYLYADFVCGNIYALSPTKVRTPLATGLGASSAVAMAFGADDATQSLYYVNYNNGGQLHKIRFTGAANRPPAAAIAATPTAGAAPLVIRFDGSGSADPDGNTLTYQWSFGDGSPAQTSTTPAVSHTYATSGTRTATLTVRDTAGLTNSASVVVHPGDTAPIPKITAPTAAALFTVGGQYTLKGTASDAEDGVLPASALRWTVIKHHLQHEHPFLGPVAGNNIPLTGPIPEDLAAAASSYLELQLSVTDSAGATTTVSQNFNPQKVPVTIATAPAGRTVTINGGNVTGPTTVTSWTGYGLPVTAPTQTDTAGATYGFDRWSDGGAAAHVYVTPATASTLTATLSKRPLPTPPTKIWIGQTGGGRATIAWSPPTSTGGSPITGYRVSRDGTDVGGTGPFAATVAGTSRVFTMTSLLTGGSNYQFSVQAITARGTGPAAAATVTAAPWVATLPTAPVAVSGSATASSATISWQPPADAAGLGVTGYRVSRDGNDTGNTGPFNTVVPATSRTFTMNFLLPNAAYNLSVQAITSAGTGPATTAGVTTSSTPRITAPSTLTVSGPATGQAAISWAAPVVTTGKTITGYRVSRDGTDTGNTGAFSTVVAATTRTFTMKFLIVGATYSLSVQAVLSDGSVAPIARGSVRVR
jgi:PKD repeat protein